ncbi:hypothetical protein [Psychrobium sp. 1_MG-2023]|uniref:hypothetical protein n=1 Tax=Psychrobium sp. 1_MG-2023 TaxID=3062624 RepID=UPI000C34F0E1|nr:hypothetical protein [Psychrobium sp. 1_MG-2023]MDP2561208.1 hypothetical protein [Psychrobium sp. 1_MG-2023]PKF55287.1 hypothetical protein CW748_13800 [Alteromonadales bacterium alter-6D02]
MSGTQRAFRLAIAGLMVIFGLLFFSQAGYFVIRYLTLKEPLELAAQHALALSAWRSYWLLFGAFIIQFTAKQLLAKPLLCGWIGLSLIATITTFLMLPSLPH